MNWNVIFRPLSLKLYLKPLLILFPVGVGDSVQWLKV